MKKIIKISILTILIFFTAFWSLSILKCEYLTFMHKEEFMHLEEIKTSSMIKVLEYKDDYARLYCINFIGYNGNIYTFKKEKEKWLYNSWEECVWAKHGTADGFMWPYGR